MTIITGEVGWIIMESYETCANIPLLKGKTYVIHVHSNALKTKPVVPKWAKAAVTSIKTYFWFPIDHKIAQISSQ